MMKFDKNQLTKPIANEPDGDFTSGSYARNKKMGVAQASSATRMFNVLRIVGLKIWARSIGPKS